MKILSYVGFAKLCNVIKYFPELNKKFVKEGLNSPLSSSSRAVKWRNKYLDKLESFVKKIDTRTHHDFTIDKSYFKGESIFTKGNEMIMTCSD